MDPVVRLGSIIATCAEAAGLREVRSPLDSRIARWAPVPVRLIVGYGFMEHGFAKLGRGPEAFADRRAGTACHGVGHDTDRSHRRGDVPASVEFEN